MDESDLTPANPFFSTEAVPVFEEAALEELRGDSDDVLEADDVPTGAAQEATRKLLVCLRDSSPAPNMGFVPSGVPLIPAPAGLLLIHVDPEQTAARHRPRVETMPVEDSLLDESSFNPDDSLFVAGDGDTDGPSGKVPLRFDREDFQHNITAGRDGDDIHASIRVRAKDGRVRVFTAHGSHAEAVEELSRCAAKVGIDPAVLLALPIDDMASMRAAGKLLPRMASVIPAIFGMADAKAEKPFAVPVVPRT